jgi:hypothetical protein
MRAYKKLQLIVHLAAVRSAQGADTDSMLNARFHPTTPAPSMPMPYLQSAASPAADLETLGKFAIMLIGILSAAYGFFRFVLRPFWDDSILAAWKRKSPDVEHHLREMFAPEIKERAEMRNAVQGAIAATTANATAIAGMAQEQAQLISLMGSLPHLAGVMEGFGDALERIEQSQERQNEISRQQGESIAALRAIVKDRESDRRHIARRDGDPEPG